MWSTSQSDTAIIAHSNWLNSESVLKLDSATAMIFENSLLTGISGKPFTTSSSAALNERGNIAGSSIELCGLNKVNGTQDYQLTQGSICIDKGIGGAVKFDGSDLDLAENPRVVNGVADVGAYEYQKGSAIHFTDVASTKVSFTLNGNREISLYEIDPRTSLTVTIYALNGKQLFLQSVISNHQGYASLTIPSHIGAGIVAVTISSGKWSETIPCLIR